MREQSRSRQKGDKDRAPYLGHRGDLLLPRRIQNADKTRRSLLITIALFLLKKIAPLT
jgi:hypothetical protein